MALRLFEEKEHAAVYMQYRVEHPPEVINRLMDFMKPKKAQQKFNLAVDVGCSNGKGTILLAPYFDQVVGTDVSPAQLEMAQANSLCPNVTYRQCPAEELPFESSQIELVTAMTAAHWCPCPCPCFLKEADCVLKPNVCLTLLGFPMDMELEYGNVTSTLNNICEEFYAALRPFRNPCLGSSLSKIHLDTFESCTYQDKQCDPKNLFSTIDKLLKPSSNISSSFTVNQCNSFLSFFQSKIKTLYSTPTTPPTLSSSAPPNSANSPRPFHCNIPSLIIQYDISSILKGMKNSTHVYLIPSSLIKKLPAITPILKKLGLNPDIMDNFQASSPYVFFLRLMAAMQVSSADTELTMVIMYFYMFARKP
ncbi:uncharacterized protein LOC129193958 [Dunckerocampus dactyliophorus]|uniref:uncharacterized protein LOC129193958 n=1 Tax=Dunckerocampus dactyliophorus TaxID=161453 RepID=UPI002406E7E2|nr:uncharacterized protein LOC129193958 [Dunckerocampus dactyliophorus]